jgi:5-methylcytosine-specific restriction endonuclease McrA
MGKNAQPYSMSICRVMPKSPKSHKPRINDKPDARQTRTQRGYDNTWLALSAMCLREEPYCRYCAREGRVELARVSDHIIPLRIRPDLRLTRSNIQSLCKTCHDSVKAREETEQYGAPR